MRSTMLVPWDDIESSARVMLNNGLDVNRVLVWKLYADVVLMPRPAGTIITSITITVIQQLLTHLLTSSFSFFLFIIITIVTAIEQLDPRGGLRALERRRACDGVFVMGTCEQ